jgi:hypothetical protein
MERQHKTLRGPSWVSHLPAGPHCGLQILRRPGIFIQLHILSPGKNDKTGFLIPVIQLQDIIVLFGALKSGILQI